MRSHLIYRWCRRRILPSQCKRQKPLISGTIVPCQAKQGLIVLSSQAKWGPFVSRPVVSNPIVLSPEGSNPAVSDLIVSSLVRSSPVISNPVVSNSDASHPVASSPAVEFLVASGGGVPSPAAPILLDPIAAVPPYHPVARRVNWGLMALSSHVNIPIASSPVASSTDVVVGPDPAQPGPAAPSRTVPNSTPLIPVVLILASSIPIGMFRVAWAYLATWSGLFVRY